MKILIVEDNYINTKLLEITLQNLSFPNEVASAATVKEALQLGASEKFDLVLMDINLGDGEMDGTDLMNHFKEQDTVYLTVPFYAVTCYALKGDRERFLEKGFNDYFSKPVDTQLLLTTIERLHSEN